MATKQLTLSVPADNYVLQLQNAAGTTTIKEYVADVTTLGGQSGVIIASGFLDPTANGNSPYGFGLIPGYSCRWSIHCTT
jgi:hypothetical protein